MTSKSTIKIEAGKVRGLMSQEVIVSEGEAGQDDSAVIQAVIDQAEAGSTITFSGSFEPTTQIIVSKSLNFIGDSADFTWNVTGKDLFLCSGSLVKTVNLVTDASSGTNTIVLDDVSGITNFIIVSDNTLWCSDYYPTLKVGESHEVSSVSGNTVTLSDSLKNRFTIEKSAICKFISPATVSFTGINIDSINNTTDGRGLYLEYCIDSVVNNCNLNGLGSRAIGIDNSIGITLSNNAISNSMLSGYGYGIAILDATSDVEISRNTISNCRHCITHGGYGVVGQSLGISIEHNVLLGASIDHTLDAHPYVIDIEIKNNRITNPTPTMYGIYLGAKNAIISGNLISDCIGIAPRGTLKNCIWSITDNTFVTKYFGFFANGKTGTTWSKVTFRDNVVTGGGTLSLLTTPNPIAVLDTSSTKEMWYNIPSSHMAGKVDRIRKMRK